MAGIVFFFVHRQCCNWKKVKTLWFRTNTWWPRRVFIENTFLTNLFMIAPKNRLSTFQNRLKFQPDAHRIFYDHHPSSIPAVFFLSSIFIHTSSCTYVFELVFPHMHLLYYLCSHSSAGLTNIFFYELVFQMRRVCANQKSQTKQSTKKN